MNNPDAYDAAGLALSAAIVALALHYLPGILKPAAEAVTLFAGALQ